LLRTLFWLRWFGNGRYASDFHVVTSDI